ncbi:MAG: tetratricopeptide repeat protein [Candidatus Omnitrophota bacterium]
MRKNLWGMVLLLMVASIGSLAPVYAAEEEMVALVDKIKPSVVTIILFNEKDEVVSQGSGFFISTDRIATNRHVIVKVHHASIKTASGDTFPVQGLLAEDELKDLAVLSVEVPKSQYKPLTLAKSLPKEGQEIVVIGSPLGLEHTVSNGIVSAVRDLPGFEEVIQITAPVSPGSSGSAVVDKSGEVVGIVVSQFAAGQNLNFSIPASQIQKLKIGKVQTLSAWSKSQPALSNEKVRQEMDDGFSSYFKGDYTAAIIHFKKVIELDLNEEFAYYFLGAAYEKLGQFEKALEAYKQAIRLKPDIAEAHHGLGVAYEKLGQYEKAIEAYKQAIRLKPDYADAHYGLGVAYEKLGHYEKALEECKQAIRLKPDFADAHYNLGVAYSDLKRPEKAIEAFKQAIRLKPDHAEANANLGVTYGRLGQYEKAIEACKQAIRLKPDIAEAHWSLGLAYGELGQWEKALEECKRTIRLKPDFADAHHALGLAYLMLNRKGEALDEYKILKNLDPEQANRLFNLIHQ